MRKDGRVLDAEICILGPFWLRVLIRDDRGFAKRMTERLDGFGARAYR